MKDGGNDIMINFGIKRLGVFGGGISYAKMKMSRDLSTFTY